MTIRLVGLEGVLKTLRELPPEAKAGRVIRNAVKKGLIPIRDAAKANVRAIVLQPNEGGLPSESTGALEAAIDIKTRRPDGGKLGEAASVGVGKITKKAREALGEPRGDPRYYAWWLELGTAKMQPHPFMRPAFEEKKAVTLMTTVDEIRGGLTRLLKKLQRKNKVRT